MNRTLVLAALVAMGASGAVAAYPISPVTLWSLTEQADVIVVAKVTWVGEDEPPAQTFGDVAHVQQPGAEKRIAWFGGGVARLQVLETWKGNPGEWLEVVTDAEMTCPAPGRFVEGETMVGFFSGSTGEWRATGLSYGTLYPTEQGRGVFSSLVGQALALQRRGSVSEDERRAWLVEAASHSATRWHGMYELAQGGDEVHRYYDRDRRSAPPGTGLTQEQRVALARAFADDPSTDATLGMTLDLLKDVSDARFDAAVVNAMDSAVNDAESAYWLPEAMALVAQRFHLKVPSKRPAVHEADDLLSADPLFKERRDASDAWVKLRQRIHVPEARVAPQPVSRVRGVGPDTPP